MKLGNLAGDVSGLKWPLCCTSAQLSSIRPADFDYKQSATGLRSILFVFVRLYIKISCEGYILTSTILLLSNTTLMMLKDFIQSVNSFVDASKT